jgi:sulfur transfer complex TusBCD TusB component (DsrH family)
MAERYLCAMCDRAETLCTCDVKGYCSLCQGSDEVRLCEDGYYYCLLCREVCDYRAEI